MTIVRYQPFSLANRFHRDVFSAFDRYFGEDVQAPATANKAVAYLPSVDVRQEESRYLVQVDLPGVESKDIEITAEKGVLTIKGQRASIGGFERRFTLPENAQTDAITAKQTNGVLEVSIPKQAPVQPKRIEIQVA